MKREIKKANYILKNEMYSIVYDKNLSASACIRIFNSQGFTINKNGDTRKRLREIVEQLDLNVSLTNSKNDNKITHQLGRDIIKALNNKNAT